MKRVTNKLQKIHTKYVWANHQKCKACWKCVKVCPQQVIGKTGLLWHKHIAIKNPDSCIGCKSCIQVCPYGVFSEDMPDLIKEKFKSFNTQMEDI